MHGETETASSECAVCVVGAGIAGLLAAHLLQQAGLSVRVLEKKSAAGGRMGQTILPLPDGRTARFDRGCQFFTAHDPLFTEVTDQWLAAGHLREWGLGHISGLDAR